MRLLSTILGFTMFLASCNGDQEPWDPKPNTGDKDNTGNVSPTPADPSGKRWADLADSTTNVLITNFLDKSTGTFWASQRNMLQDSWNQYWQQAHAMDVLLYSYQRVKESNPELKATYEDYFRKWYDNDANNYNNSHDSEGNYGGFFNDWTDDMAWICLTLIHMADFTGEEEYAQTSREIFDNYIWTRSSRKGSHFCLPWTNHAEDKTNFNACTNAPSCLVAALLYQRFGVENYKTIALNLYAFNISNMPDDERVEEPPLSYTQGTFAEAARVLYHITGEKSYMDKAGKVLSYAFNSNRTTTNGLLRSEGENMDQAIFKAVLIPYTVNYILDEDADKAQAAALKEKLILNAEALSKNMDRAFYPSMFANYYWGEKVQTGGTVNMGAQVSGASLIEGVARLFAE